MNQFGIIGDAPLSLDLIETRLCWRSAKFRGCFDESTEARMMKGALLFFRFSVVQQHRNTLSHNPITMDLNSLKDQVSNLTLYDLKAGVRKVQNGNAMHPIIHG